jgi:uncharacterized protein (TIGR02145 family)
VPLNIQGTLTPTGVQIKIPYTYTGSAAFPIAIPDYEQTVQIPANATEGQGAREVRFGFDNLSISSPTGFINAYLEVVGSTNLLVKRLDLQAGVGNDNMGALLAQFIYPISSNSAANFQYRAIAGIPDGNITDPSHRLLYFPVTGPDNRTWLNNNLGANYSNINNANFNPTSQAFGSTDFNAYGSLFQWGRYSDGHELVNWTSSTTATAPNASITTLSGSDQPGHSFFIRNVPVLFTPINWRSPPTGLWGDANHTNNPCPLGYRVPNELEVNAIRSLFISNAATAHASSLRLTVAGRRDGTTPFTNPVNQGVYWTRITTPTSLNDSRALTFSATISNVSNISRGEGASVRCIRN